MHQDIMTLPSETLKDISLLAFEQSFNSVVITTSDVDNPLFLYVNPAFSKLTGYTADEVIGKNPKILQGEKTDREVIERLKKCLKEKKFFQGSTINYKKDGSKYHVEWNISPLLNDSGEVTHFVSFQMDVTSKVELLEKNKEILIQQSKLASVGELMNAIVHQWKQPLNAISLLSQRLLQKTTKEIDRGDLILTLERIIEQSSFMNDTVKSFQNFLRPSDLKSSFYIKDSINDTLLLIQDSLIEKNVIATFNCEDENIKVNGSENEFKQVILNLISNAKDAFEMNNISDKREIEINLTTSNQTLSVSITDNAGGIKLSPIEKVFENNVSTKGSKGTGIGLYIVKQIVERLKGKISVSLRDDGNGTKFSITLPFIKE